MRVGTVVAVATGVGELIWVGTEVDETVGVGGGNVAVLSRVTVAAGGRVAVGAV
jgi:hypothetical protein